MDITIQTTIMVMDLPIKVTKAISPASGTPIA
jgi:hypothetical protein